MADFKVKNGLTASGAVTFTASTASTSTTTGALIVTGGVGITGALNATSKSFAIPHPTKTDHILRHGSLEGPEFGVYVRGRTDSNIIELPDYWPALVDKDTITVTLTAIGSTQHLFVTDIRDNKVYIANGKKPGKINCFYVVFAERMDIDKLVTESEK